MSKRGRKSNRRFRKGERQTDRQKRELRSERLDAIFNEIVIGEDRRRELEREREGDREREREIKRNRFTQSERGEREINKAKHSDREIGEREDKEIKRNIETWGERGKARKK